MTEPAPAEAQGEEMSHGPTCWCWRCWFRWQIARLVDRYSNACWADLASWAWGDREWEDIDWKARLCQDDARNNGHCWCLKVRR